MSRLITKKRHLLWRTLVYSILFAIQTNRMFQSPLDLQLLTLRFGENKQVDLGLQEFLLLEKEEDIAIKFAQIVGKWGIIALIAPTLMIHPKREPTHLHRSQAVNRGVDDQEFAQFVDNSDTLEVDVICIMQILKKSIMSLNE